MISVNGEEYLTVKEATRLLGVKPATLYAYVSRGVLRSYRQGIKRQRLYRRAEVEGLLRLAPSATRTANVIPLRARARRGPVPLARSWVRDRPGHPQARGVPESRSRARRRRRPRAARRGARLRQRVGDARLRARLVRRARRLRRGDDAAGARQRCRPDLPAPSDRDGPGGADSVGAER